MIILDPACLHNMKQTQYFKALIDPFLLLVRFSLAFLTQLVNELGLYGVEPQPTQLELMSTEQTWTHPSDLDLNPLIEGLSWSIFIVGFWFKFPISIINGSSSSWAYVYYLWWSIQLDSIKSPLYVIKPKKKKNNWNGTPCDTYFE